MQQWTQLLTGDKILLTYSSRTEHSYFVYLSGDDEAFHQSFVMTPKHILLDTKLEIKDYFCTQMIVQGTMNSLQATTQVTDEQIIIFHLVLQVYCSPSLKEHLHNPVMTVLACNIQRKESILCAQCCVCVHKYTCIFVCCMSGCVVVYTRALVCAFMCVSSFRMVDTNLQLYYQ